VPRMVPAAVQNGASARSSVQRAKEKPPGKSATYRGAMVRRQDCKGRALPAELSARGLIVAELPSLVNRCVGQLARRLSGH
jgi:hypothetical protein